MENNDTLYHLLFHCIKADCNSVKARLSGPYLPRFLLNQTTEMTAIRIVENADILKVIYTQFQIYGLFRLMDHPCMVPRGLDN